MNPFRFRIWIPGLFMLFIFSDLSSQKVQFSAYFEPTDRKTQYTILGADETRISVLSMTLFQQPELLVYDTSFQLISRFAIPDLQYSALHLFQQRKEATTLFYEFTDETTRYYKLLTIKNGNPEYRNILELPLQAGRNWIFKSSPRNGFSLLYQLAELKSDSVRINVLLMNREFDVLEGKNFQIRVESQFDQLGNIFLDDQGNIYFMTFDQPLNFRLGSRIRLYRHSINAGQVQRKEFYLREKKPGNIHLTFSEDNSLVYLHSLYYGFYSKNVDGLFMATLNQNLEQVSPARFYEFDKEFKKSLNTPHSGISSNHLMNYLQINNISISPANNIFITVTLETKEIRAFPSRESGINAYKYPSLMESNPILGIIQRDAMMNQIRRGRTTGRIAGLSSSGAIPSEGSHEAYSQLMNRRPDLFFMENDTSSFTKPNAGFLKMKIYDRQILFDFKDNASLSWRHWFETEEQSLMQSLPLSPLESEEDFISVFYRHNIKEQPELAFTQIEKVTGQFHDKLLSIPDHLVLLTTTPMFRTGRNKLVMLYQEKNTIKTGLATISW